jgi:TolB protein
MVLTSAQAQVTVSKNFLKKSFAVTGFAGDATVAGPVAEVLKNDLKLSGYFDIKPSSEAEFVQQGSVRRDNGGVTVDCTVIQSATKRVVLSKSYPGSPKDLRRLAHVISDDIVLAITGQRGIAQTKIAFVLSKGRNKELAVMDYDGHNARQITSDNTISARPRWSPDGQRIVYTSYLNRYPDVVEANIVTGRRRNVAQYPGVN